MLGLDRQRIFRAALLGIVVGGVAWIARPASEGYAATATEPGSIEEVEPTFSFLLFDPPSATPPALEREQTGHLVLRGLSISSGRVRALVAVGDGAPVWLETGEAVGEWTLIGPTRDGGARFASTNGFLDLRPFSVGGGAGANE